MAYPRMRHDARSATALAKEILGAGLAGGVAGGLALALFEMMYAQAIGQGFWMPVRLIAAAPLGVDALVGGVGTLLLGLVLHIVVSAGWGILFALVVKRESSPGTALALGLLGGGVILVVMTYLVVPWANPTMRDRIPMMVGAWIAGHLLYGVGLAYIPTFRRRLST